MSILLTRRMSSKVAGVRKSLIRGLSTRKATTSSSLPSFPYLILSMDVIGDSPSGSGSKIANFNLYDPKKQKPVTMAEQVVPEGIHLSENIGSSRGWIILLEDKGESVHLTNIFNPSVPKSAHKVIPLPLLLHPYNILKPLQEDVLQEDVLQEDVRNVSLSCSPDNENEDCIVAIKFRGTGIAFYITADSQWTWRDCDSLSSRFDKSFVIYSNKDHTFYLTPSIDTFYRKDARNMEEPEFPFLTYYRQLGPLKLPKMGEYEYELLRRCTKTKHLVETPSGEFFIIVNYALATCQGKPVFPWETQDLDPMEVKTGTMWFMLYSSHDPTTRVQDIGDLCIFLGKNEPFCVPTSMYPGLKPNSIYFTQRHEVYNYNISHQTFCKLPLGGGLISPIWLQPI